MRQRTLTVSGHARHVVAWATAVAAVLVGLAGCAATQLKASWKDPAFTGPPMKQLLVIGAFESDLNRRVFEDAFVATLQAAKTGAVASYPTLPESGAIANDRVQAAVRSSGADAVLVTRLMRVRRDVYVAPTHVSPGFYGAGFGGWYGGAYATMPSRVDVYDVLEIESTLWNMRTDKPVWSGSSEVTAPQNVGEASKVLAGVLVTKMKADGVL